MINIYISEQAADNLESYEKPEYIGEVRIDLIESPFTGVLTISEEETKLDVSIRDEMRTGANGVGTAHITGDNELSIDAAGGQASDIVEFMLSTCIALKPTLKKLGLEEKIQTLNDELEGVYIYMDGDVLKAEVVEGKKRPDLACTTLFGGVQMTRPYEDEVMDSWLLELIPFEDKLEAAEQGDEDAMLEVAVAYLNGDTDVEQDAEKAVYWFQKLAELDNSIGQFNLAVQYVKGEGVEQSFEKALYWMKKADENGDADAADHIEKYQIILEALEKANAGDACAMAVMSEQYMNIGANIGYEHEDKFFAESFEWAKKAAEQNNLEGIYLLGLCYEHGRGTELDKSKAVEVYRKAAEQGHDKSQWNLAVAYIQGEVIDKDVEQAQYWAAQSAAQGYNLAVRGLFAMTIDFYEGDWQEKCERLEKLAAQCPGDAEVYHKLALAYMDVDENGNMYDMDRAIYWFKQAGDNGHYMSEKQYHLWSYVKKLQADGIVPEDGDYLGYVINNGLLDEAENYEP